MGFLKSKHFEVKAMTHDDILWRCWARQVIQTKAALHPCPWSRPHSYTVLITYALDVYPITVGPFSHSMQQHSFIHFMEKDLNSWSCEVTQQTAVEWGLRFRFSYLNLGIFFHIEPYKAVHFRYLGKSKCFNPRCLHCSPVEESRCLGCVWWKGRLLHH